MSWGQKVDWMRDQLGNIVPQFFGQSLPPNFGINISGLGFYMVKGDLWIAANAYYDGTNWQRQNTANYAYALNYCSNNNIPFEASTGGIVMWRCVPGANPINSSYGVSGGWEMVQAWTQFKDSAMGGFGLEVDGNATLPYFGRLVHNTTSFPSPLTYRTGVVTNLFVDFSNVDQPASPSWFFGVKGDAYVIERSAAPGSASNLTEIVRVLVGPIVLIGTTSDFNSTALQVNGSASIINTGSGFRVREGSNAKQGTATLTAGSVVVSNTAVTANSRIFLTSQVDGGTPGFLRVSARTAGTSFTITSSSGTDTSTVAYEIFEPA